MTRDKALSLTGISKYQYYKRTDQVNKKPGRKSSISTLRFTDDDEIEEVLNETVIDDIVAIKSVPDTDYGYRAMTSALMLLGYIINHKKVYRLMGEYFLLHKKPRTIGRKFVKYRRVNPSGPLEVLEMDIKYQWVHKHGRHAFILTVIDCFTRKVLCWTVAYSIKQAQVKKIWEQVIVEYLQPNNCINKSISVEVRNDNDSRFAAKEVQQFFKSNFLSQVFTHPYTPQENGHIESFHAILSRSLARREYARLINLEDHLKRFYKVYNEIRLHGSLDHLSPNKFWKLWNKELIERRELKNKSSKFKLKVPHYLLSGNGDLREVSSLCLAQKIKEVASANSLQLPSVQR